MSRKTEQRLWDRMRAAIDPQRVHLERVENLVGAGIPDVLALAGGAVTWCELKAIAAPKARAATPLLGAAKGLNTDQRNWHLEWARHGGRSLVVVGVGPKTLYVIDGKLADFVNSYTVLQMSHLSLCATWSQLQHLLEPK